MWVLEIQAQMPKTQPSILSYSLTCLLISLEEFLRLLILEFMGLDETIPKLSFRVR